MRYLSTQNAQQIIKDYCTNNHALQNLWCYIDSHLNNGHYPKPDWEEIRLEIGKEMGRYAKITRDKKLTQLLRWVEQGCPVPEYEIRGFYNGEREAVTSEPSYSLAKAQLKCYRENEPGTRFNYMRKTEFLYGKDN